MAVLINLKICDNAPECGGVVACPTGAISYSEDAKSLVIDNEKCITCFACESECPIGAINVAKDETEYERIAKEIEEDPRQTKDLFVDRYGAAPLSEFFMIKGEDVENKIVSEKLTIIEVYEEETIACLLKSIPIKEITDEIEGDIQFFKMPYNEELKINYNLNNFPSLLFFKDGKLLGIVEGYYETSQKSEFVSLINNILK